MRLAAAAFLFITSALVCSVPALAQDAVRREDQLKAAYLVNFVQFIDWPADAAESELHMCFVGGEGVHAALRRSTEGKQIGSRRVSVRMLAPNDLPNGCSVLYIGADAAGRWTPNAPAPAMLTVGDVEGFARRAGIIELYTENNRLRFFINVDNARRAGLRISSNLLRLATIVAQGDAK